MNKFQSLTTEQKQLLPTEEDVLFYEKNGWYISPVVLEKDVIDEAISGAQDFYNGVRDYELKDDCGLADDGFNSKAAIRNNEFVTLQKKELKNIGFNPLIMAIAAKLARVDEIRLFGDSLVNKLPQKPTSKGVVGWHSDKAYWPTCSSDKMLTVWIPFQDVSENMGPLTYISQSHLWKEELELKKYFSFGNQNLGAFEDYLSKHKPKGAFSQMTLKKGQVSFHNSHTIHCSYPNTSSKSRLALAVHLQDGENKYKEAFNDKGEKIIISYDKICRKDKNGKPDYSDPNLFPILHKKFY